MSTYLELDPIAERLLEASRDRRQKSLAGRERWARVVAAAAFAAVAVPLAVPAVRNVDAALLAALVGAFALASRIEFEVGSGFGVPTEVVLVPMFFLLPPRIVPLAVALGFVLGQLPEYLRRGVPPDRVFVSVGNAWFAIGPVLVFLAL